MQEEAARQQGSHVPYNKVTSTVQQQVMPPPQIRMPQMPPGPPLIPMDQWQHR